MDLTEQQILHLRMALGEQTFAYMVRSLQSDRRITNAHMVDIVIRKDAVEKRIEADWLKTLARMVRGVEVPPL
jgi:hypothetical protein